jgi:ribosomal protein L37E
MNQNSRKTNMTCNACGSHSTQTVPTAYSKAFRSSDWTTNVSLFGQSIAPPEPRSTFLGPLGIALITFVAVLGAIPTIGDLTGLEILQADSPTTRKAAAWGLGAAIIMFIVRAATALFHNLVRHPDLIQKWENQIVCNRCSHVFHLPRSANRETTK